MIRLDAASGSFQPGSEFVVVLNCEGCSNRIRNHDPVMSLFWEFHQDSRISSAEGAADQAATQVKRLERRLRELERRFDRTSLACQALWELVRERAELSDSDLHKRMTEIDLRDGIRDGKIATTVLVCPNCGNRSNSRRQQCIYCGETVPAKHTFS